MISTEKLADLAALRQELADVKPAKYEEDLSLMELPTVFENFRNATERLQERSWRRSETRKRSRWGNSSTILDAFFAKLEKEKDRNAVGMLQDFQGGMFAELPEKIELLKSSLNPEPVTAAQSRRTEKTLCGQNRPATCSRLRRSMRSSTVNRSRPFSTMCARSISCHR